MYKIRRGKDFKVIWSFFDCDGNPYILRKEYLALFVKSSFSTIEITDFSVQENKIIWVFKGKDQKNLGDYSLELFTNNGEDGMIPVDSVDAFTLVQYSKDESSCTCDYLKVEDVSLKSDLDIESMYILANFQEQLDKKADKKDVDTAINTKAEEIYNFTGRALTGLNDSINQKLAAKVDKVSGKQLSTEDFTTALKQKLQGLNNYDDSALTAAIDSLQNQINTLVSGNASSAIDTFNEIVAFLDGVKNTEDLAGIIASIEQQIASVNSSLSSSITDLQNKDKQIDSKLSELFDRSEELLGGLGKKIDRETAMEYITDLQAKDTQTDARLTELSAETEVLKEAQQFTDVAIKDLQDMKIDRETDDYYPQLSVGLADNLAGVDVVASEFSFRRSGGGAIADGNARIETIKGNSLVWNQLINNVADTTGNNGWWARTGSSVTIDGSRIEQVVTGPQITQITQNVNFKENHKYLVTFDVNVVSDVENIFLDIIQSNNLYGNTQKRIGNITQKEAHFATIYTADAGMPYFSIFHNVTLNEGYTTTFDGIKVIDLTLMFGVGNEPTTIEDAYARMPIGVDLNAYEEGKVIDLTADSLVSRGFNQWDEEWEVGYIDNNGNVAESPNYIRSKNFIPVIPGATYYMHSPNIKSNIYLYDSKFKYLGNITKANIAFDIPRNAAYIKFRNYNFEYGVVYKNDLCINLSDPSKDGTYEPYIKRTQSLSIIGEGLKSAGTAHDEIRYNKATQKWEKVQRIGSVDLGNLSWAWIEALPFFRAYIADKRSNIVVGEMSRLLCKVYAPGNTTFYSSNKEDKTIYESYSDNEGTAIYISDSSYTDTASFKAAMQGVMLYYELAEPIVTILDDDFNLDYEVWNGGTEEVISDVPTTPLKAEIAYGFNAVGKIKDLEEAISNLPSGESSVFAAVWGETSYEELKAAYEARKICTCVYNNVMYNAISLHANGDIQFVATTLTSHFRLSCTSSGVWSTPTTYEVEKASNKVTSLSSASTDMQYPSAKAVYEALQNVGGGSAVFEAKFKETSYEEVKAAFEAKKMAYCHHNNRVYLLSTLASNVAYFSVILGNYHYRLAFYPSNPNPSWSEDSKNFTHSLETLSNGNAKVTIAGTSAEVASGTPSGDPMHYMFEAVGATYNATDEDIAMVGIYGDSYVHKARHWHLNELGDITTEEMRQIYLYANLDNGAKGVTKYLGGIETRTNIATWSSSWNGKIKDQEAFADASKVIVARMRNKEHYIDINASYAFTGCTALQKILPTLDATSTTSFNGVFDSCNNLMEVRIKNVKVAIKFNYSPLISKASILYLIQNSAATSAITITLHADAYARLAEDADIVAALAEKTNVSLAK